MSRLVDQYGVRFEPDPYVEMSKAMTQRLSLELLSRSNPTTFFNGDLMRRTAEEVTGKDFGSQKTITFRRYQPCER